VAAPEPRALAGTPWWFTAISVIAALAVGVTLAVQLLYISDLRNTVGHLENQVTDLQAEVCSYQQVAQTINRALAVAGRPSIKLPPPRQCPPPP
jgi:hypothetical protein